MANNSGRTNFEKVLQAIREEPETVMAKYPRMLSDLSRERAARVRTALAELESERRAAFYRSMDETSANYYEFNYAPIAEIGIKDENGAVRAASIHVLGFEDTREVGAMMLEAARSDPDETAQIAAIEILGQYMFESAIENRIPVQKKMLRDVLKELIENKNAAVRRAAVVSYAISESKRVQEIITGYFAGNDREELIAGLRAARVSMSDLWARSVLELISHEDEDVSMEAIKTAGVLQLREVLPLLYEIIAQFDRISPDLLITVAEAIAEIGDESSIDVLEMLGEAAVDMDQEITDAIDECIDTLNMSVHIGTSFEDLERERRTSKKAQAMLNEAIERAKDNCLSVLEEKIPHDLEDDEPIDLDEHDDEDECDCGDDHHHHHHHHHAHEHDNPLEGMDLSRFRILDDLEAYESAADRDEDEEELWTAFEEMAEEDLDADSLQEFIGKLEKKQAEKKSSSSGSVSKSGSKKKSGKKK